MKISIASDLHLEFGDCEFDNAAGADVLVLSGDIMIAQELHDHPPVQHVPAVYLDDLSRRQASAQRYRGFLQRVSDQFEHVVYVAGNHEFYHGKWPRGIDYLREECARWPNVYFMENDSRDIGDLTFVGCTLWTDMNRGDPVTLHAIADIMADYSMVRNSDHGYTRLRPAHTLAQHRRSVDYIRTAVTARPGRRFVVVGHMAPSSLSVHENYRREHLMNGAYYSDLSDLILDHPQIALWTHGHTHHEFDYMIGSTRIVCNPRGYVGYEHQADVWTLKTVEIL